MNISLESKRVVVTRGSSGLSEAMSLATAVAGAKVAVNYSRPADKAKAVVEKIQAAGGVAFATKANVSKPKAAALLFAAVEKRWGGDAILINHAGIDGERALAWEADFKDWSKVLEINLNGAFLCAAGALKRMVPKKTRRDFECDVRARNYSVVRLRCVRHERGCRVDDDKTPGPGSRALRHPRTGDCARSGSNAD